MATPTRKRRLKPCSGCGTPCKVQEDGKLHLCKACASGNGRAPDAVARRAERLGNRASRTRGHEEARSRRRWPFGGFGGGGG